LSPRAAATTLAAMKALLPLALLAAFAASAVAADLTFYLGTYTRGDKSKGIYLGKLDAATGKLGAIELAAETANPSFLALSPNAKHLYAVAEGPEGGVTAFSVGEGGKLTKLNSLPAGGAGTCHVWVDATGRNVFAANYSGGSLAAFQTKADGSLAERTAFVQLEGSGPNPKRQQKPAGHAIYSDAENKFVYGCDLGSDQVWSFRLDAAKGTLTPTDPPSGKVPPGGGPRHFAIHPNGRFAYTNNEMTLTVTTFTRDAAKGTLTALDTISTLPPNTPTEGFSTAEIFCHPKGKWLYVSNRGHDTIAVFAIATDGKLTFLEAAPAQVKVPRGFGIDPSGKWLVAGGQNDHRIAVHAIDPQTGRLSFTGQTAEIGAPVCVIFKP
jgi:6-phosphogluconolactonase